LVKGTSRLNLEKGKLKALQVGLDIGSVERKSGYLEYMKFVTNSGIEVRYYEDGLYIVEVVSENVEAARDKVKKYYDEKLEPALDYLFSLGAPTPKILANIIEHHPVVVGGTDRYPKRFKVDENRFGKVYLTSAVKDAAVFKTSNYIFTVVSRTKEDSLRILTEMQIFFREFKSQLHRYLNIHRSIWEEIADIKEKKMIRGGNVEEYRAKLDSYQKTIRLIQSRINQMGSYARTRASISKELNVEGHLIKLFQYRFEDLFNTLSYIQQTWGTTSAIGMINEVDGKRTSNGIHSIQFLAGIGVVMGLLKYLNPGYMIPSVSITAIPYFAGIGLLGFALDWGIKFYQKKKRYKLKFVERTAEFGEELGQKKK